MRISPIARVLAVAAITLGSVLPQPADGQIFRRLRDATTNAAEREVTRQVETRVTNIVQCAFDDLACIERARQEGRPVAYVDDQRQLIVGDDGAPVTDRDEAARALISRRSPHAQLLGDRAHTDATLEMGDVRPRTGRMAGRERQAHSKSTLPSGPPPGTLTPRATA